MRGGTIVFFGDYNPGLLRCRILEDGFGKVGWRVVHCPVPKRNLGKKGIIRNIVLGYIGLLWRLIKGGLFRKEVFLLPEARLHFFIIPYLIKKVFGVRIMIDVYDFAFHKLDSGMGLGGAFGSLVKWYEKFCLRNSDLLLVESDGCMEVVEKDLGIKTGVLVWPVWSWRRSEGGGDPPDAVYPSRDDFNLLYWGNYHFHHGIDTILSAAAILEEKDPTVKLYFVGRDRAGKVEKYRREAERLGLSNCIFTGRLSEEALNSLIRSSDVCLGIFSSHQKAMVSITNKVFESLSMGKPTITARSGVMERYFNDGENIVLCEPDSPEDLAEKVMMLKNDAMLRKRIGQNAYDFFWHDFDPVAKAEEAVRRLGL